MSDISKKECESCGATLEFDSTQASFNCAFCGSEMFIEIPESPEDKVMREDAEIILFKIEKEEAKAQFGEWIKKGLFKPSSLASSFEQKEFDGVYIPFFKVTADASTRWYGRDKEKIADATEDEEAIYEYMERSGQRSETYKDFITATKGLDQNEVDNILPFDDNETKPYDQQLMAGYKIEAPAIKQDNAETSGREGIKDDEKDACRSKADEISSVDTTINDLKSKLIMLPIWILVYNFEGKPYRVVINGQTGKVSGEKPVSKLKVAIAIGIAVAIGVGIFFATR